MEACRNVEIKARLQGETALTVKKKLDDLSSEIIDQVDYFFNVPQGRLKLRSLENSNKWELIFYDRPDTEGPKLSEFRKVDVNDGLGLLEVLRCSLGVKGEVRKRRLLFMSGQTRIHFDEVQNLGTFLELEVMLNPHQTVEEGNQIAHDLMNQLGVPKDCLLAGAYMDLLLSTSCFDYI